MQPLTITIIQASLFWENKAENLRMFEQKIKNIETGTELVILPEMFSTGFSMNPTALAETMDGETVTWMKKIAAQEKIILTGSVIIKENEQYFNRLIWMLPNGEFGTYDKRHLFGFANEDEHYHAGNKRFIAQVKGWKINLLVCYDLRFPVWARQANPNEYDVLVYVANWPERRSHAWKTLLCARAIENQCCVIGVNRVGDDGNKIYHSGNSMVIDAMGQVLYHKADDEDVHTFTLQKDVLNEVRTKLPFLKDGDAFNILG
jgi:omega-amidase